MLGAWAERWRRRLRSRPTWQRRLADRGLDPYVLRSISRHGDLGAAWQACPRIDWAVEIAVRAPVEPAVLSEGLDRVEDELAQWQVVRGAFSAGRRLMTSEANPDALLESLGPALLCCVDDAPAVQAKLRLVKKAEKWRDRPKMMKFSDAYDAAHAEAHLTLTSAFRRGVPVTALRVVLEERQAHPYR